MPTGRPDYWYGTALYFDDSPGDGEVTRGPTANWAYDHVNNPSAHHVKAAGGDVDHSEVTNVTASQHHTKYTDAEAVSAVKAIVDDTPVNGEIDIPVSSNWAFDHLVAAAHHSKYTDAEAVTAMGVKGAGNPLHHDKAVSGDIDHGAIGGLDDDDHGLYLRHDGTRYGTNYFSFNTDQLGMRFDLAGVKKFRWTINVGANYSFVVGKKDGPWVDIFRIDPSGNIILVGTVDGVDVSGHAANDAAHHARYTDAEALTQAQSIIDDTPADADTTHAPSSNWAYDHDADASAHHSQSAVFVDRGDVAGWDLEQGAMTMTGAFIEWDLSSIVPAGAIAVLLQLQVTDNTVGATLRVRNFDNSNMYNIINLVIQAANQQVAMDGITSISSGRKVKYQASEALGFAGMLVKGWWIK